MHIETVVVGEYRDVKISVARHAVGAVIGLMSAGAALGVGELVAAFVRPQAAPAIAVGNRLILLTPEPVKRWAIRSFGTGDKDVLLTGIYLGIGLFALVVGVVAVRRFAYGLIGIAIFAIIGGYCALTANASHGSDVVPTIVASLVAAAVLRAFVRLVEPEAVASETVASETVASEVAAPEPRPRPRREPRALIADRRHFLAGSVGAISLAAVAGFGGRALQKARFDVAQARAKIVLPTPTGAAAVPVVEPGTDLGVSSSSWVTANSGFYRIDTALTVPQLDPGAWRLRIHGMVDHEITINYAQLSARPMIERWITLCCVSNEVGGSLIGNARFLGAPLVDLLREAGVQAGADQLILSSADGMTLGSPTAVVMDGRDALVAIGMNGVPLPIEHGFPARIVVPGLYGYVSACKWVVDIEATTYARQAYWAQGGWAEKTDIKLESRIDTPGSGATVTAGKQVPVAGVAWDQHVGVSKVELQVDNGPWQTARLASVPSTDTWRQWIVLWTPPKAGSYVLRVRATDGRGELQTTASAQPYPSGATGLQAITVRAR